MNKVLYIDPFSTIGHLNFNRIYINGLQRLNIDLNFVMKEDYSNRLGLSPASVALKIPDRLFVRDKGGLINRYYYLKILRFIKKNIDLQKYNYVIFAGYDEIALFFSRISKRLILINHNNLSGLSHPVKRMFFKLISGNNIHIVFEKYMKDYLVQLGVKNIFVIPHGLPERVSSKDFGETVCGGYIFRNIDFNKFRHILFSPSGSKLNNDFLNEIISGPQLIKLLEDEEILLIVRGDLKQGSSDNILHISDYLSDEEYSYIFGKSSAILICYPASHRFRVSSVLFECMANNKICFMSDIDALRNYSEYFKNPFYFTDSKSLAECVNDFLYLDKAAFTSPYNNLDSLEPEFSQLLGINE